MPRITLGMPVVPDRDRAWRDYAGWRVNYDRPLLAIAGYVEAPPVPWVTDRSVPVAGPTLVRRRR